MKKKILVMFIILLFANGINLYGFELKGISGDTTSNGREVQLGIYAGYIFSPGISDAHGNHGSSGGQPIDASVENIELNPAFGIGINTKIYFTKNIGIEADLLYSRTKFPEQTVLLNGYPIYQPKSDLNFFTVSLGPGYRYKDDGIWQKLNPYASAAFSALIGYASDVNYTSTYGQGGYSEITGIGFNLHFGAQYHINSLVLLIEYRFEYISSKVDYFRSFTEGLYFVDRTSSVLFGVGLLL
jgi:Outer membrane protein beta-barrel domain